MGWWFMLVWWLSDQIDLNYHVEFLFRWYELLLTFFDLITSRLFIVHAMFLDLILLQADDSLFLSHVFCNLYYIWYRYMFVTVDGSHVILWVSMTLFFPVGRCLNEPIFQGLGSLFLSNDFAMQWLSHVMYIARLIKPRQWSFVIFFHFVQTIYFSNQIQKEHQNE